MFTIFALALFLYIFKFNFKLLQTHSMCIIIEISERVI